MRAARFYRSAAGAPRGRILISHPAKQGNFYTRPIAAVQTGWNATYLTGIYWKPGSRMSKLVSLLPGRLRERARATLEKRRDVRLDDERVVSIGSPWLEGVCRPLGLKDAWYVTHDILASRWLGRHEPPAILHCFDGSSLLTMRRAKAMGVRTVYEVTLPFTHRRLSDDERERLGLRRLDPPSPCWARREAAEWKTADYLIAQSVMTVETALEIGIEPGRIALLPFGVDTDVFYPDVTKKRDVFTALFVGQVGIRKGVHWLLEAWRGANLTNAELLLVGPPENKMDLKALLARAGSNVRWLGRIEGAPLVDLYQSAHVFVFPSIAEGGSNVLHEAMACALPVIITNRVGCVVEHGVDGFVVAPGAIDDIVALLRQIHDDPSRFAGVANAARTRAKQLSWEGYAERLSSLYEHVLTGAPPPREVIDLRPPRTGGPH